MQQVSMLCSACHRQIHKTFTEKELEQEYNTIEALRTQPEIEKFVKWIEGKPHGVVRENGQRNVR
jgi:hypothetical protein